VLLNEVPNAITAAVTVGGLRLPGRQLKSSAVFALLDLAESDYSEPSFNVGTVPADRPDGDITAELLDFANMTLAEPDCFRTEELFIGSK
jgi:hypothetical protein